MQRTSPEITTNIVPLQKKQRNASFELLRIFSMLFIITHHFQFHGGWSAEAGSINGILFNLTNSLFLPSVNIFVMISAYFLCTRTEFSVQWKKLGKLWLTVFFYSVTLYVTTIAMGIYKYDQFSLIRTLFPVIMDKYWFFSAYFVMLLLSPLLNLIIAKLNKAQFLTIIVLIILFSAHQDFTYFLPTIPLSNGYNAVWFVCLYMISAYIRKFDINLKNTTWIVGLILFCLSVAHLYYNDGLYISLCTVIMSIFLILTAKKFAITNKSLSKTICFISSLTFGVYLIHDSLEIRGLMYEKIFHSSQLIPSKYSYLIFVGFVLATFFVCAFAEWLRQLLFLGISKITKKCFGNRIALFNIAISTFIRKIINMINTTDMSPAQIAHMPYILENRKFDCSDAQTVQKNTIEK